MTRHPTAAEAQAALERTARAERGVAAEVGLPRGYWWAMATGWVVLGIIGDLAPWGVVAAATIAFGAGHATLAGRLLDGRRRSRQVRVSAAVAGRRTLVLVIGMLVAFVVLTVAAALALDADGAAHPAIEAGVLIAVVIALGGDQLLRALLRRTGP